MPRYRELALLSLRDYVRTMQTVVDNAIWVAMGVVLVILLAGIANMLFSSDKAKSRSNQLMRWRVGAQFVAIMLLLLGFWLKTRVA
jgi:phosphatidylglycerophosphate synthase